MINQNRYKWDACYQEQYMELVVFLWYGTSKSNIFIRSEYFFERNESMCGISHDKIVETSLMMSWMLRMSSSSSHALVVCFGPNGQECQKELWCVIAACLSSLTNNFNLLTDTFVYEFREWWVTIKYILLNNRLSIDRNKSNYSLIRI